MKLKKVKHEAENIVEALGFESEEQLDTLLENLAGAQEDRKMSKTEFVKLVTEKYYELVGKKREATDDEIRLGYIMLFIFGVNIR
jgi:antitoxin component of RelBE/YafQ-DinJ toxin-antitoxin module